MFRYFLNYLPLENYPVSEDQHLATTRTNKISMESFSDLDVDKTMQREKTLSDLNFRLGNLIQKLSSQMSLKVYTSEEYLEFTSIRGKLRQESDDW